MPLDSPSGGRYTPPASSSSPAGRRSSGSRIRARLQQLREMHVVPRQRLGRARRLLGRLVQILVVDRVHRLAVPVRAALRRDAETHISEGLIEVGGDLVGAVLV